MENLDPLLVTRRTTIREALARLDETGQGILLLVDGAGLLQRTVTDGDIRRLILVGASLSDTLDSLPAKQSITLASGSPTSSALELMDRHLIDHVPQVDVDGRPCGLIMRRELNVPILLSTPHLGDQERDFVEEAFRTNWVAPLGPNVDAFERELADHVNVGHAAAVSSGTAAIHLGLILLGVGRGDTVFCSSLTFVASANPILYQGATPVFIDSDPESWNMSTTALKRALEDAARRNKLPRAVVVVNLYGQSADMAPILELCNAYQVPVLEDAAESLGATYKGRASGTWGKIGVYSFNGNKIITTSGGGMLVAQDAGLVEQARFLATQARDPAPWYLHSSMGFNYRMSNILAGIGRGQLRVLEQRVSARRAIFEHYRHALEGIPGLGWMPEATFGRSTRWLSVCMLNREACGLNPGELIAALAKHNIEARHVWNPMHRQPLFAHCSYYPHQEGYSFSDIAFAHGLCLPSGSNLSSDQIERVSSTIRRILGQVPNAK